MRYRIHNIHDALRGVVEPVLEARQQRVSARWRAQALRSSRRASSLRILDRAGRDRRRMEAIVPRPRDSDLVGLPQSVLDIIGRPLDHEEIVEIERRAKDLLKPRSNCLGDSEMEFRRQFRTDLGRGARLRMLRRAGVKARHPGLKPLAETSWYLEPEIGFPQAQPWAQRHGQELEVQVGVARRRRQDHHQTKTKCYSPRSSSAQEPTSRRVGSTTPGGHLGPAASAAAPGRRLRLKPRGRSQHAVTTPPSDAPQPLPL